MLIEIAEDRPLPTAEGVIGERRRNRHIDTNHSDLNPGREVARDRAVSRENRDAITVFVIIGEG